MSSAPQKVSFTIRRPTPVSRGISPGIDSDSSSSFKVPSLPRHLSGQDVSIPSSSPLARSVTSSPRTYQSYANGHNTESSDEDEQVQDELVLGFDKFGVQRANGEKKTKEELLIIPALKNKDWRELARKRRNITQYVPPSAKAETGADGSVGGLGTRDFINSGPALFGLQFKKRDEAVEVEFNDEDWTMTEQIKEEQVEETEDQRALRAILTDSSGMGQDGPVVDIIPTPISEADALKQDVAELPDVATLDDYARVPVSQFGAAMLRGMGWKEGTAATRKQGKGLVEPYLPTARPALLGIGAKEQDVYDNASKKGNKNKRPERRYVPVIKKERNSAASGSKDRRDRSQSPNRLSRPPSRLRSRSPHQTPDRDTNERGGESTRRGARFYDPDYDRNREWDKGRERERDKDRNSRGDSNRDNPHKQRDTSREPSRRQKGY